MEWSVVLRATGHPEATVEIEALAVDADQSIVVAGTWRGTLAWGAKTIAAEEPTVFVAKLNRQGTLAWWKTLGQSRRFPPRGLAVLSGGDVVIAAPMHTKTWDDTGLKLPVQRLNGATGTAIWRQEYAGTPVAVSADPQGRVVVAGDTSPPAIALPPGTMAARTSDVFIATFASDGRLLWQRSFGARRAPILRSRARDSDFDFARTSDSTVLPDGSVIVTGQFTRRLELETDALSPGGIFVIGVAADGAYRWSKRYPTSSRGVNSPMVAARKGGVAVIHPRGDGPDSVANHTLAGAYEITQLDRGGHEEWSQVISPQEPSLAPLRLGVEQDGTMILAALFQPRSPGSGHSDLLRLTPEGNAIEPILTIKGDQFFAML